MQRNGWIRYGLGSALSVVVGVVLWATAGAGQPATTVRVGPQAPFSMEFVVTPQQLNPPIMPPVIQHLDYRSPRDWELTVVNGGESTGYHERALPDGSVEAGYPDWEEPMGLAPAESGGAMMPGLWFVPRQIPRPGGPLTPTGVEDPDLAELARGLGLDPAGVVSFEHSGETTVYDLETGVPLLMSIEVDGRSQVIFRVLSLRP